LFSHRTLNAMTRSPIVAETFLASLAAHRVDFLFANPGTDFPPIVEAYARGNTPAPRPVLVPHENLAVAMAHGAYLVTGRTQAVMVHVNVGTANTINMLANLARDKAPLLLCAGRTPITEHGAFGSRNRPIHWAQEMFDQASMVRELVKWDYEFKAPARIDHVVARAFEVATAHPQGPVYLSLPREPLSAPAPDGTVMPPRVVPASPALDPAAADQLVGWLATAERPVVLTGAGARDAAAVRALEAFATAWALPVVQTTPQLMNFASTHAMHGGYDSAPYLRDADHVIVLEADVPWNQASEAPPTTAKVVQMGIDPVFQRYPMRTFRCDLAITATAHALVAVGLRAHQVNAAGKTQIEARRAVLERRHDARRTATATSRAQPSTSITPALLSHAISEMAGHDAIIFNEYPLLLDHVVRTRPGTYFGLSPAGGLGWGLGAAIGAKMAAPDTFVVATLGDGAYMFANPTACHWMQDAAKAPVLTIIFNNSRYGAVRRATLSMFQDGASATNNGMGFADLGPSPPFHAFVAAQGGFGACVERPEDLADVLARAKQAVIVGKKQALVNVICPY
jgi:acetolactate synthase I/II/III large subunit